MQNPELSSLDLNLLVALDALLEQGSVSGAARQLGRSQPAVSRILARLRDMLGDPLLVPHGRGLAPTPRALAIRAPLRLLLSDAEHLVRPPEPFDPSSAKAHLRIISSDYAQVAIMGQVVSQLEELAPGVTLEVLPVSEKALAALAAGSADLLLGPAELCPSWCECEPCIDDAWCSVRRKGKALPTTLDEYLEVGHIAVGMDFAIGNPVDEALLAATGRPRQARLKVPDFAGALFVVATSSLLATVPRPVAEAGRRLLAISTGNLPFTPHNPSIAMIWPRRLAMDPAHVWLRETVRQSLDVTA